MAFKDLITNQVNSAFNLIGDLAEDIIFLDGTSEYNFNDNSNGFVESQGAPMTIKGVISQQNKNVENSSIIETQIILKSTDVTANNLVLDNYDTLRFRNKDWTINNYTDNGFITTIFVKRSTS